jgi:hypothetical protein
MVNSKSPNPRFVVCALFALAAGGIVRLSDARALQPGAIALAQTASDQTGSIELEQTLFVEAPENGLPKDGIHLVWLPGPLQKLCLGKSASRCATIDYCIRTTNRDASMCRNLGIDLARFPPYPPSTRPRRMLSLTLFKILATNGNGFDLLQNFYKSAPRASLERLSMNARIKARIQFIRKPDDDDFNLLQVIAVPPL